MLLNKEADRTLLHSPQEMEACFCYVTDNKCNKKKFGEMLDCADYFNISCTKDIFMYSLYSSSILSHVVGHYSITPVLVSVCSHGSLLIDVYTLGLCRQSTLGSPCQSVHRSIILVRATFL